MAWSRWKKNPATMIAVRISERVATWLRLEPQADAWASYGALSLAAVGVVTAILALPSF